MMHNRIAVVLSLLAVLVSTAGCDFSIKITTEKPTPEPAVVKQSPSYNPPVVQPAQPGPNLGQYEPMPLPQVGNQDPPPHVTYPFSAVGLLIVEHDEWTLIITENNEEIPLNANGLLVSEDQSDDPGELYDVSGVWFNERVLVCRVEGYGVNPDVPGAPQPRLSTEGPCAISPY